jgi:thiol-disulfide isomerase/thioredoxin
MYMIGILLIGTIFVAGCAQQQGSASAVEKADMMDEKTDDSMMKDAMDNSMMETTYQGTVLAGDTTPYIDFNKADYDRAVMQEKTILLYFYADWCPSCRAEQAETEAAFDSLERDDVVGFRVSYRDSNVDTYEKDLAREHGITYQHTKVIIKDGERVLKAPDSWGKERYLEEIGKV